MYLFRLCFKQLGIKRANSVFTYYVYVSVEHHIFDGVVLTLHYSTHQHRSNSNILISALLTHHQQTPVTRALNVLQLNNVFSIRIIIITSVFIIISTYYSQLQ